MAEMRVPAHTDRLPEVTAFVARQARASGLDDDGQRGVLLALDELFTNIAHYAYPPARAGGEGEKSGDEPPEVVVSCQVRAIDDRPALVLELRDRGVPFDPLAAGAPDLDLPLAERSAGGLGIFLVRQMMDAVEYERQGGENVVRVTKWVESRDVQGGTGGERRGG